MAAIPKHKGTKKLLQQLKNRHAKLRAQQARAIVVANKLDASGAETRLHLLRRSCPSLTVVPVSMAKAVGLKELPRQP